MPGLVPGIHAYSYRFGIIKDVDGRHKPAAGPVMTLWIGATAARNRQPTIPLKALLIQEAVFSLGSTPPVFTSV